MNFTIRILVWPFICCVTLGKPLNLSEPRMAHLYTMDLDTLFLLGYGEDEMRGCMENHCTEPGTQQAFHK